MNQKAGWVFPDADEFMVSELSQSGTYQLPHLQAALGFVRGRSVAVDGGAHVGTWSRRLAREFKTVIAFEPASDTFQCLVENMHKFGCVNVDCCHAALSDVPGSVALTLDPENAKRKNTGARHVVDGDESEAIALDSLNLEACDFIKLDVEGFEPRALKGAKETIDRFRPIVLFENKWLWSKHYGMPKHAVREILISHRYQHLYTTGNDQIWGPR